MTTSGGIEQALSAIAQDGFDGAALAAPMLLNQRVRVGAAALRTRASNWSERKGLGLTIPQSLLITADEVID